MAELRWRVGTRVKLVSGSIPTGFKGIFSDKSKYHVPNGAIGVVTGHKRIRIGPHPRDFVHSVRFTWIDPKNKQRHSYEVYVTAGDDILKIGGKG